MLNLKFVRFISIFFGFIFIHSNFISCKEILSTQRFLKKNCDSQYSITCLKLDIISFIEKLSEKNEYKLYPGVILVRDNNKNDTKESEIVAEIAKNFPNDPESRLDNFLLTKIGNFVQSLSLRWKLIDTSTVEKARSVAETGRKGKIGKKGGLEAIIAAAMMMKGTLMTIGMGALALLAGKALLTALLALTLSALVGLKSLTSGGKSTTYEIVAKPVYQTSHSHSVSHEDGGGHLHSGYGGYGRSVNIELPEHLKQPQQ